MNEQEETKTQESNHESENRENAGPNEIGEAETEGVGEHAGEGHAEIDGQRENNDSEPGGTEGGALSDSASGGYSEDSEASSEAPKETVRKEVELYLDVVATEKGAALRVDPKLSGGWVDMSLEQWEALFNIAGKMIEKQL